MSEKLRISLGIPSRGDVKVETALSLMHLLKDTPHEFHLNFRRGTYLGELRNEILKEALEVEADYLMFVDTDMVFEGNGVNILLSREKDVIGAVYNMRSLPPMSTIKAMNPDGTFARVRELDIPKEPFRVYAVPTGFMLIKLSAVRTLKNPFDFMRLEDGEFVGEDIAFCERCRQIGVEVWCDPTIKMGHVGDYVY